jgi:hypothetical protein
MIANFFQSLDERKIEYLLISGQAAVLYGAATFLEDIDLWLNPTPGNRDNFLSALRSCGARYYKLTPNFTIEHLVRGHGFHFVLPGEQGRESFLDIMGAPPRVGSFASVAAEARWIETEWGNLHTIGIKELVELKKTQRLEDYAVIGKLVLAWFHLPDFAITPPDRAWAIENVFTLTDLQSLLIEQPAASADLPVDSPAALKEFIAQFSTSGDASEPVEAAVADWLQQRMAALQPADRHHWRSIIDEFKEIWAAGGLMTEGAEL